MSVTITPKTVKISTGVVIELSSDAATHLSYALGLLARGDTLKSRGQHKWPWLNNLIEQLDAARGKGCSMGGRLVE